MTAAAILGMTACAPKPPAVPSGPGTPFPDFARAYAQATAHCGDIRTMTLSIALSGRAGRTKLRGHIDAGFATPARARLEGLAPFGKPVFVLVADGESGTLVLVRDNRVLRNAPPGAIVEALAGVDLGPAAMRSIVAGCGFGGAAPAEGRLLSDGWAVGSAGDDTVYVRNIGGVWRVAAARRGALTAIYTGGDDRRPASILLRAETAGRVTAELTLGLSEVDVNTSLDPHTFQADVPPDADPMTLDELRRAGPLGGAAPGGAPDSPFPVSDSKLAGPSVQFCRDCLPKD